MSDPEFTSRRSTRNSGPTSALRRAVGAACHCLETLGFWAAVVLPLLHVSLLFSGLGSASDAVAFGVLVGLNLVSLLVGRDRYDR